MPAATSCGDPPADGAWTHDVRIALLVLTYNWPEALARVLSSAAKQTRPPDEILVADDGSGPDTAACIAAFAATTCIPVRHLWQDDLGFRAARCRNLGISASGADYIVMIDGDMLLHPHFIEDHARFARPGTFLQGGRIRSTAAATAGLLAGARPVFAPWSRADFRAFDGIRRHYAFRAPWLARWKANAASGGRVMSCNMSAWRADLVRVNGFDEGMVGYGAEDRELAARLANAGVRRRALKWAALAVHLEHATRAQDDVDAPDLPNNRRYEATRRDRLIWCERGIADHVAA